MKSARNVKTGLCSRKNGKQSGFVLTNAGYRGGQKTRKPETARRFTTTSAHNAKNHLLHTATLIGNIAQGYARLRQEEKREIMPNITIKNDNKFNCDWKDINNFLDHPLDKVRALWKIMFEAAARNEESIEKVKCWLENQTDERTEKELEMVKAAEYAEEMKAAAREAVTAAKRAKEDYIQSKKNHERVGKLRDEYQKLTRRYWF
jgi:hypothetical protein